MIIFNKFKKNLKRSKYNNKENYIEKIIFFLLAK